MHRYLLLVTLGLWLAGCQTSSTVREVGTANRFVGLAGASLVLNQPLRVGAGKARVFVQNGEVGQWFDSYQTHCAFEITSVNHEGWEIEADTFTITRVQGSVQPVVVTEPLRLAALWSIGGMDDVTGAIFCEVDFWPLDSARANPSPPTKSPATMMPTIAFWAGVTVLNSWAIIILRR